MTQLPPVIAADAPKTAAQRARSRSQRSRRAGSPPAAEPEAEGGSHSALPDFADAHRQQGSASPQHAPPGIAPSRSRERSNADGDCARDAAAHDRHPAPLAHAGDSAFPAQLDNFGTACENHGWDAQQWRQEQEALFEAEMAMQSQQMLSIIGTEWANQGATRAQAVDDALQELRGVESKLSKVRAARWTECALD